MRLANSAGSGDLRGKLGRHGRPLFKDMTMMMTWNKWTIGGVLGGAVLFGLVSGLQQAKTQPPPAAVEPPRAAAVKTPAQDAADFRFEQALGACRDLMRASNDLPVAMLTPNMIEARQRCAPLIRVNGL
jgi:hypothetical protein